MIASDMRTTTHLPRSASEAGPLLALDEDRLADELDNIGLEPCTTTDAAVDRE